MWVVKLGGSLADSDCLPTWLAQLSRWSGQVVLVPGGGAFADGVRSAQKRWNLDDASCHRMALLAMEQMGLMLCAMQPGLVPATQALEMKAHCAAGLLPVWMPSSMVLRDAQLPQSWSVSSDSLALWLAARLRAEAVLLVKSAPLPDGPCALSGLQRMGVVDDACDSFAARLECPVWLVQRDRHADLDGLLSSHAGPMCRVSA